MKDSILTLINDYQWTLHLAIILSTFVQTGVSPVRKEQLSMGAPIKITDFIDRLIGWTLPIAFVLLILLYKWWIGIAFLLEFFILGGLLSGLVWGLKARFNKDESSDYIKTIFYLQLSKLKPITIWIEITTYTIFVFWVYTLFNA